MFHKEPRFLYPSYHSGVPASIGQTPELRRNDYLMPRGFAALSPERRKEIARRGAERLHKAKRNHVFTPEEAVAAAKKRHAKGTFPPELSSNIREGK